MSNKKVKMTILINVFLWIGMLSFSLQIFAAKKMELISVKTNSPIVLDGVAESAWSKAPTMEVEVSKTPYKPNNGYEGMKATNVRMRSLHDQENIYFFIQYDDPTLSLERFPWVKQADGSWKQLANKDDTGHDNTYYEDKFAMYWDINARGFAKKGCAVSCHLADNGMNNGIKDKSPGRKYTQPGQTIDMWHWKGVRTNAVGQFDDQFVDSTNDPEKNSNWGRKGDHKTGGGYTNNINDDKTGPAFMNKPASEDRKYFVMPDSKVPFVDTFKTGDVVPGIIITPFQGHRGDIKVKGVWNNGVWTLEVMRKLVTVGEQAEIQDVQFTDLKKPYYFGVSVFDNSQINHIYHEGSIQLTFK